MVAIDSVIVSDEIYQKNVLRALADDESRRIIACTISGGKSVADIVRECNVPHTSAYRLVNELKSQSLLIAERLVVSRDGKKYVLYRSSLRGVMVRFVEGQISIEVMPNRNIIERTYSLFSQVSGSEHP